MVMIKTQYGKIKVKPGETALKTLAVSQLGLRGMCVYIPSIFVHQVGMKPGQRVGLVMTNKNELILRPLKRG